MPLHEIKPCSRCGQPFQCKVGSIAQCECSSIVLSEEVRAFIASKYEGCLCFACLKDLDNKHVYFKEKYFGP